MLKIPERIYLVTDIINKEWKPKDGGDTKIFQEIILCSREIHGGKEYDTFLKCQMAYKSTQEAPEKGSMIKCEIDISSRFDKSNNLWNSFGIYEYSIERMASEEEPKKSVNGIRNAEFVEVNSIDTDTIPF